MNSFEKNVAVLFRQLNKYLSHVLADTELTASELLYLEHLFLNDGITQEKLSQDLSIDRAATTRTIQSMEQKGLVTRTVHPDDRRAKSVCLTEKGRAYESQLRSTQRQWMNYVMQDLSAQEVRMTNRFLQQMASRAKELTQEKKSRKKRDTEIQES